MSSCKQYCDSWGSGGRRIRSTWSSSSTQPVQGQPGLPETLSQTKIGGAARVLMAMFEQMGKLRLREWHLFLQETQLEERIWAGSEEGEMRDKKDPMVPSLLPGLPGPHLPCWARCWSVGALGRPQPCFLLAWLWTAPPPRSGCPLLGHLAEGSWPPLTLHGAAGHYTAAAVHSQSSNTGLSTRAQKFS